MYFVTVVTQNRACLFGKVVEGEMFLNEAGDMIEHVCQKLPQFISNVDLACFVIMPNHFHGIIKIEQSVEGDLPQPPKGGSVYPGQPDNIYLSNVVQRFKSLTPRRYIEGVQQLDWPRFNGRLWQRNYYEHVVRNKRDYQAIVDYIVSNPRNWEKDKEHQS